MSVFFHVDLDAFFPSVEVLDNPALKGKAVIVGAPPRRRGVVSSCSYEARRFGVRSAMPSTEALRRCPQGIFLPPRMERYAEVSRQVMQLLESYTPVFQQLSIDEACLDLTGTDKLFGPPRQTGMRMKEQVRSRTGLTISVGIAANRYLAKLASTFGKPDGLLEILPGEEIAFLDRLELKDLWGVGEKTLQRLQELNVTSIAGLRGVPEPILCAMMGEACGRYLFRAVRGTNPEELSAPRTRTRSISNETTFEQDRRDLEGIRACLLELAEAVMYRLVQEGWKTRTVFLKLRTWDFVSTTARTTIRHWLTSSDELYQLGLKLLKERWDGGAALRLLGLGCSNLEPRQEGQQGELFEDASEKRRKVEEAVIGIRSRNRGVVLTKASLLPHKRGRKDT